MGKRIITQRRGRGTFTYIAHSHKHKGKISHRVYDAVEKENMIRGKVIDLIHCSGHSAPLAIIRYDNGEIVQLCAPMNMRVDQMVESGKLAKAEMGNTLPLAAIPEGTSIFNIELEPGDGGKLVRAAGASAKLIFKKGDHAIVKLPSRTEKIIKLLCRATIGEISGGGRSDKPFVKAGKRHHLMRGKGKLYPRTSGVAMNATDHPFGSGRGRHAGRSKIPARFSPPGRNVGLIRAKRTGRRR
ncbi:50S ribosomal protein L2 [Candidatus Woesearchaeota archaeon]|nr:50S ribosomal protein L2 [Candidatus Woesearchaeota archaeon]